MIDAILYIPAAAALPASLTDEGGNPALSDPKAVNADGDRLHYIRMTAEQLDEWRPHVTVLAETPYKGVGTADYLYTYIQQRGELNALYYEVCPLKQLYWTDPETGEVNYDAAMGTEFVRFGMLAESPLPVPSQITARQARLALVHEGLLFQVEGALENIEDDVQRQLANIEWEYAGYIERDAPWLIALSGELGLSKDEVDNLFRIGATL